MAKSWERHIAQIEDDEFGEYLLRTLHIHCPYCGVHMDPDEMWELNDYNVEMPPLNRWLKCYWVCGDCFRNFTTEHELNQDGYLKDEVRV